MANPQQPELARSRKTPNQDPDSVAAVVEGQREVGATAPRGPVPPENQPGNRPEQEQDKPDLDAFASRFGIAEGDGTNRQAAAGPSPDAGPQQVLAAVRSRKAGVLAGAAVVLTVLAALGLLLGRKRRRSRIH